MACSLTVIGVFMEQTVPTIGVAILKNYILIYPLKMDVFPITCTCWV